MRSELLVGDWTVVPSRNLLTRGDEEIRWKTRFVTDDVLTVTIYALRKALGDEARRPRDIETVSRRGFRFPAAGTESGGHHRNDWLPPDFAQSCI